MRTLVLLLTLAVAPALTAQNRLVVKMDRVEGLGPFHISWMGTGEASDPIGGPFDALEDSVTALPKGLHNPDVRFLDLQLDEAYRMGYLKGNVKKAMYDRLRRYYGTTRAPDSLVLDQRLDYAVGRDDDGNYAVVFDTDNDEDLSDETVYSLPWVGPPMSMQEFADSVMNTPRYDELAAKLPAIEVESEALVDGHVVTYKRGAVIMPFLHYPSPGPSIPDKRLYLLGYKEHREGQITLDGTTYTIFANADEALFRPTSLSLQVAPATAASNEGIEEPVANARLKLGDVIKLGNRLFRFEQMTLMGDELELVDVTSRSPVAVGSPAPSITANLMDGGGFALSDLAGKYVLLKFWSANCSSCFNDRMNELYSSLDKSCIDFIGVGENGAAAIKDWTLARGTTWPEIADQAGDVGAAFGVRSYPTDVLVNPVGEVVHTADSFDRVDPQSDIMNEADMLNRFLPAACYNPPTADEVTSVFWRDGRNTEPVDYLLEGCSYSVEDMSVESVGDRNPDRGWPVTLDVSGQCTPRQESDRDEPWHQDLTLNMWMYQNMGDWALLAREPFVAGR